MPQAYICFELRPSPLLVALGQGHMGEARMLTPEAVSGGDRPTMRGAGRDRSTIRNAPPDGARVWMQTGCTGNRLTGSRHQKPGCRDRGSRRGRP